MYSRAIVLGFAVVVSCVAACGGQIASEDDLAGDEETHGSAEPVAVYTHAATGESCPSATSTARANEVLTKEYAQEDIAIVSVTYEDECTGAGGQYILANDLYQPRQRFFLGNHGCNNWTFSKQSKDAVPAWGVLRYFSTSAQQKIPAGVCIGNEANRAKGITTESAVMGIALFTSRAGAESFARTMGWQKP